MAGSELKKYRDQIMEDGIAHIRYHISDVQDIIHPFSVEGDEMLTPQFREFLEKKRVIIPANAPILLELTGATVTDGEKNLIDRTIWTNFCLRLSAADMEARICIRRCLIYLLFTILSTVLLFTVADVSEELIVNLAYIPFYFFGYRFLIYVILDSIPLWKERAWYRQLASLKLCFSEEGKSMGSAGSAEAITAEVLGYRQETGKELKNVHHFLKDARANGRTDLVCSISSLKDVLDAPELEGGESMSDDMEDYLAQVEPFFSPDVKITLNIGGAAFTREEKSRIENGIRNYYGFRIASGESAVSENRKKILVFMISVVLSAVTILVWRSMMDVAWHELFIMLFWFFADYALEFILITRRGLRKERKILENCRDMRIVFTRK